MRRQLQLLACAAGLPLLAGCPATDGGDTPAEWNSEWINSRSSTTPVAVRVADMDRDGLLDVVSAWRGTPAANGQTAIDGALVIDFQDSPTSWTTVVIDSGSRYAQVNGISVADMNGDQNPDIAVAAMTSLLWVRAPTINQRLGVSWTTFQILASVADTLTAWFDVAAAQIDGTGGVDLVAANGGTGTAGRLVWLQSPGTPDSTTGWTLVNIDQATRSGSDSVLVLDLNGDSRPDVISTAAGESTNSVSWYEAPADPVGGTWIRHPMSSLAGATRMAAGDLNGDAKPDLAVITPTAGEMAVAWLPQPTTVTARWPGWLITNFATFLNDEVPTDVAIADIDGDSKNEVVVSTADPSRIFWFKPGTNSTQYWFETRLASYQQATPGLISLGDINKDGRVDVVVPVNDENDVNDRVEWLENPGVTTQPAS